MDLDVAKGLLTALFFGFCLLELRAGRFLHRDRTTSGDLVIEIVSICVIPLVVVPTILASGALVAEAMVPDSEGWLSDLPAWAMFGVLLVGDDLTQYWWHRISHTPWLFPLHRAHHSAHYLSVRLVYRNNLVYYLCMPGLWVSAVLVHWGFGSVYAVYIVAKLTVIIGAHSSVPWDEALYRWRWTRPVMWFVERTISTPATHAAHHGMHESDGTTHYRGNYGNFLFLWDVLFGTAKITRRRPEAYGLEGVEEVGWLYELLLPVPVHEVERPRESRCAPPPRGE